MGRNEALEKFFVDHLDLGFATQREIRNYYHTNRETYGADIEKALIKLIRRVKKAQENGTKEDISYISICFLRSNFYVRNGNVRIYALDRRFVLDTEPLWEEVDFAGLCELLWKLEDTLCLILKQYKNKIYRSDVQTLIQMEYIPKVIGRITAIAKEVVRKEIISRYINDISKTHDFCILSGEYQGEFEEILVTEAVDTKGLSLKEFLKIHKKESNTFCAKQYLEQTVDHLDLRDVNFAKSRFIRMDFSDSDFSNSILLSTEWQQCTLKNTCFKEAVLFGASFIDSDLRGSDFSGVIASVVPENVFFRLISNLDGICFNGTILEYAKFTGADLRGADFRGARFYHTDFSEAFLEGAMFDKDVLEQVSLSTEQMNQIRK